MRTSRRHLERAAAARAAVSLPPIAYPEDLPVSARRSDIAAAIAAHQVVIVAGETGSGKTTQLPKIALELGRGRAGQIGHTQPRRIAARTVAERIAFELGVPLGGAVGYQVRFTDESADDTLVKVMTDGVLLAQIQRDPRLLRYDTLIVDEAHERSLNIDFLLGYLTRLLPSRPDLTLVITSATIDSARFAAHFAGSSGTPAPIVEVTGRTYPVEIRYRPLVPDPSSPTAAGKGREAKDLVQGIVEAVDEVTAEGTGDVLVFLSGEREIRDAADALRGHLGPRVHDPRHPQAVELLPLYARLSFAEQRRVFEAHAARRIVLATNVAETSLTVPGVRYVVDSGTARISRYSKATKVQRLPIEPISQASANQRSGRSGRLAPGIAVRLYGEDDFAGRPPYTEPEILRTSLASVILQMVAVGVVASPDEVADFPFVDKPDVRAVRDGVALLTELGALTTVPARDPSTRASTSRELGPSPRPDRQIDSSAPRRQSDLSPSRGTIDAAGGGEPEGRTTSPRVRLTDVGRALAQLPIDPRLARMVVEAGRRGVAREVAVIAAALSIQDPRERPAEQREQADALHRRFADPSSDLLTYLNLWTWLRRRQKELSGSAFRRLLRAEHLNYLRVREWQDVVTQLRDLAKPLGIDARGAPRPLSDPAAVVTGDAAVTHEAPQASQPSQASQQRRGPTSDDEQTRWEWDADPIHAALLSGLLSQVGMQLATDVAAGRPRGRDSARARNEYLGARGARFAIFPGSPLARRPPGWVMAAELVETSRLWARDVARIKPEWVEELAPHLVKRTYSDPGWSSRQGAATVTEKVLLYGIPVVAGRRVLLAKVDPAQARELFIRHALVGGEWTTHHEFFHLNRHLLEEAEGLEARARQRGLVVDDDVLFDFYDERVGDEVVSSRHFDTWWKRARRADPDLLTFTRELLVRPGADIDERAFPSRWPAGDLTLPLTYQFEPGSEADGVTVHVPLVALPRLRPEGFDWMVPGLRAELITATIRALPKAVRVQLVPAPDVARAVDGWMDEHLASWADTVRAADAAPSFHDAFAAAVRALRDVEVPPDAFDDERLPPHLRMTFRVVDGGVVDEGKDLLALQRRLAGRSDEAVSAAVRTAVRAAMDEARAASHPAAVVTDGARGAGGTSHAAQESQESQQRRDGTGAASGGELRAGGDVAPGLKGDGLTMRPDGVSTGPDRVSTGPDGLFMRPDGLMGLEGSATGRDRLSTWPDDLTLPDVVETRTATGTVRGYPALVDPTATSDGRAAATPDAMGVRATRADGVGVRVLATPEAAAAAHRVGVRRLLFLDAGLATARITTRWTGPQALALATTPYPSTQALVTDVQLAAIDALVPHPEQVRDPGAYAAARAKVRDALEDESHRLVATLVEVLAAWREADRAVRDSSSLALVAAARDVRAQLAALVADGFVARTGAARLPHLTRYLRAATHRLAKAAENPHRDAALAAQVREAQEAYDEAAARAAATSADPARDAALDAVRWQLEELRVSLFAQHLGTPEKVSAQRIRRALASI